MAHYSRQVFLNVPFDKLYRRLFHALVFGVHECGLVARCAQEKACSSARDATAARTNDASPA